MKKFSEYLKEQGYISAKIIAGPNGDFIAAQTAAYQVTTFPVGKKSQGVKDLFEYNVVISNDGQAIATINNYVDVTDFVTL
tara:strand:+ start:87 stop:329 length:243 start_codon:yes stop_codon:yes gene_type:complete